VFEKVQRALCTQTSAQSLPILLLLLLLIRLILIDSKQL